MRSDSRFFVSNLQDDELIRQIDSLLETITESDKRIFLNYVELTRHIIELDKLFNVFRYNLTNLLKHFTIFTNDLIESTGEKLTEDQYYYQINALTINLISSAKTLTESIEVCMKNFLAEKDFKSFKNKILSKPYDEHFSYRFLLHMRNYSQHGHLPVNIHQQRVYFDLDEILAMPHFDFNGQLKKELDVLRKDIYNQFRDSPRISYVYTVAKFNLVITEIYFNYLKEIKPILIKLNDEKNELLLNTKFQLINSDGSSSDMLFYEFDGENYHCFNRKDNSISMYADIKREVKKILKVEEQYYKEIEKRNQ
ncbi:hypothetical protein EWI08_02855 [Enterococcus faecium]|nr:MULTISPECIES: hypothetical protein [Enterococcus]AOM34608.1 hypothetical protein AL021_09475 [Enterococcus faecium]AVJ42390.1 hypothetical protein CXH17_06860 [Enterococcus faecium]EKC6593576.1 hypothetical protein [Enterococcus faecium]EKC6631279.1 hypothetical protein [Enterococcus faecium]EKY7877589.1 hypothetical protein [Enterococcus faecium]